MEQAKALHDFKQFVLVLLLRQEHGKNQSSRGHKITQSPGAPTTVNLAFAMRDSQRRTDILV